MLSYNVTTARAVRPGLVALVLVSAMAVPGSARADDPENATDIFSIGRGGQYYDKWWAVIDRDAPKETHPAYGTEGKQKGSSTWRCKECHGWDYKGKDGAYGSGSHYSGIKGITGKAGADPKEIAKIIRGAPHNYTADMLPDKSLEKLSLFVSKGQIDTDKYIDRKTKKVNGDAERGARIYQTVCASCHGFDGKKINFKTEEKPEYIGTIAQDNPWEALHKTRHGQPGQIMPALIALDVKDSVDIVAYAQTLPAK